MPHSTLKQQIAQQTIGLLNHMPEDTEESRRLKNWFQALGITLQENEEMFGKSYTLTKAQVLQVAELDFSAPDWFQELEHPLQYAVPGLYVSFLLSTGRHTIMTVTETRTINRGATTLIGLDGIAQGWYNVEGYRTTKEGQLFQGSAYAGHLFPVDAEILLLIERQELLTTITGHHQAYFAGEGMLHRASIEILREIHELLQTRAHQATAPIDVPQS